MTFKMNKEAQTITIYNLSADTQEFIGAGDAYIPAHTGLPAYCTDIEPPEVSNGSVAVFDATDRKWSVIEDHRGMTVYDISDGNPVYISSLGPLADNLTCVSPDGEFKKWDGNKWIKDDEAEKKVKLREAETTKNNLMQLANDNITPLQDAVDLDMATDEEKENLLAWKKYRVLIMRVDTSSPEWPTPPTK